MSIFDGVLGLIRSANDHHTQGYNEALREIHHRMKKQGPFAWHWYDDETDRYEFALRREDAHEGAQPLYRQLTLDQLLSGDAARSKLEGKSDA